MSSLFEDEQIEVPTDFAEDLKFDYKTNKRFLFTAFVLLYLKGVVAMTTTPSSGQVRYSNRKYVNSNRLFELSTYHIPAK